LAVAQQRPAVGLAPSKVHHSGQIPYRGDERKKGRQFFRGTNASGFDIEMHETVLGAGVETHPPHRHEHEEIVIVVEGSLDVHLEGKTEIGETGSVLFFGSNQAHTVRAAGTFPCRYYFVKLRGNSH
jgi:quercetin dioxygenase-like cupin family protein